MAGDNVTRDRVLIARRNVEGGGRDDDLEHTDYRIVARHAWRPLQRLSYDAYYQYGTTQLSQTYLNDFSVTRLDARDRRRLTIRTPAVVRSAALGRSTRHRSELRAVQHLHDRRGDPGGARLPADPGFQRGNVNETDRPRQLHLEAASTACRRRGPNAASASNVGAEYRKERLDITVDVTSRPATSPARAAPTPPVNGEFDVHELFAELQIPIVSHSFIEEFTHHRLATAIRTTRLRQHLQHRHLQGLGGVCADPRRPLPRQLQPRRPRSERRRAVRAAERRPRRHATIPAPAGSAAATLAQCANSGVTAAQYGDIPKPTRPTSTTACSAATRT